MVQFNRKIPMGRPKRSDATDVNETVFWTCLVVNHTGLTDNKIGERMLGKNDESLEGWRRNFNRWRTGKRSMSRDSLSDFVKKARKLGLLPTGSPLKLQSELRLYLECKERPSDLLALESKRSKELHAARAAALQSLERYKSAIAEAHHIEVLEPRPDDIQEYGSVSSKTIDQTKQWLTTHVFVDLGGVV